MTKLRALIGDDPNFFAKNSLPSGRTVRCRGGYQGRQCCRGAWTHCHSHQA